jgi:hypothetical protein
VTAARPETGQSAAWERFRCLRGAPRTPKGTFLVAGFLLLQPGGVAAASGVTARERSASLGRQNGRRCPFVQFEA